jgi:predicted nucleic acid-binding protein
MRLVDSDVVIDLLRQHPPAVAWFASQPERPGLPGFVLMELVAGCRTRTQMQQMLRHLRPFPIYWPTQADCARALTTFMRGHFSHRLGLVDAIIGECAVGLPASLITFNIRHFQAVPGLATEQPYPQHRP